MAARATWKGFLKISLVTIPVQVYPATESAGALSFNQLHATCRTRLQQKRWCATCQAEVANTDVVKGFEFERGRYVVLSDEDVAAVRPESTRVIDLVQFTPCDALDPMYVDRTYYLAPDGTMAAQAYAVMAAGMVDRIGVGKLALYGREYLVAVRSVFSPGLDRRALVLHTLHHAAEIRPIETLDALDTVPIAAPLSEVQLARQVIDAFDQPLDLERFRDAYQDGLRAVIDAKVAGEAIAAPPPARPIVPTNLLDSLKASLERVSRAKKPSAKAAPKKKSRVA